jgi:CBS domain-containing protein
MNPPAAGRPFLLGVCRRNEQEPSVEFVPYRANIRSSSEPAQVRNTRIVGVPSGGKGCAMNVDGILRAKGASVVTVRPDATVENLVRGLREERIGVMVVSEDGRSVLGMISERDVIRGLAERGPRILQAPVAELMTRQVVSCTPDDTVKKVMAEMTKRRFRHLPVLRDGVLCGIISIGDVVKNRLEEMEMETNVLREAYIVRK